MTAHNISIEERIRLHSIVEPNTGCWLWEGAWDKTKGYGRIKINGKTRAAHRISYEVFRGEIPTGEGYHGTCVLHICNNPACVNPEHLILGTQSDNIKQMWRQKRNHNNFNDASHRLRDRKGRFI